jgi:hypothetical protein
LADIEEENDGYEEMNPRRQNDIMAQLYAAVSSPRTRLGIGEGLEAGFGLTVYLPWRHRKKKTR